MFCFAASAADAIADRASRIAMPRGTQTGRFQGPLQHPRSLRLLQKLAIADLAAFGGLYDEVKDAFPSLAPSAPHDCMFYSSDLIKALAAAASRGLQVATTLFSSSSAAAASCSSSSACFQEHEHALWCVGACIDFVEQLCNSCMMECVSAYDDLNTFCMNSPDVDRRRRVQLAVAFKSAGVCMGSL
jgi:hypothetical protein